MPKSKPHTKKSLDFLLLGTIVISLVFALLRLHLVEKDFTEILGSADGLTQKICYSFIKLNSYVGLTQLTGFTARPPLIPLMLAMSFSIFGHRLSAIYLVYLLPRLVICPLIYLLAKRYTKPVLAYMAAMMSVLFPYYDTYAISTLKADVFVVAWSVCATYWVARYIHSQKHHQLIWVGIFLGLNTLSKETATAFSATLLAITSMYVLRSKSKIRHLSYLWLPVIILVGPFMSWSFIKTGRLFPSLYATAIHLPSFPLNFKTYLLSIPYYAGISFHLSKSIVIESFMRLSLLIAGITIVIKKHHWELILPILGMLIGISLTHTLVVQGDLVGNREILHRISPVVPFTAILIVLGISSLRSSGLSLLIGSIVLLGFAFRYFRAPFALDYTANEFYISAKSVFIHQPLLPFATFEKNQRYCVVTSVPGRETLQAEYRPHKVSPFPRGLKEITMATIILPVICQRFINWKNKA